MTIKYKEAVDAWDLFYSVYKRSMVWKEDPVTVEDIDPEDQIVWAMEDGWDDTHPWCAVKEGDWMVFGPERFSSFTEAIAYIFNGEPPVEPFCVSRGGLTFDRRRHD